MDEELARTTPKAVQPTPSGELRIEWADGHVTAWPFRDLRLTCGCAHCVEEGTGRKLLDPDTVAADVRPTEGTPVGRYGFQIVWSDGHQTGIFPWDRLRDQCPCSECAGS